MSFWHQFPILLILALASLGPVDDVQADPASVADPAGDSAWAQGPSTPTGGIVGNGDPASCTEAALAARLSGGGAVTFNCGGPKSIIVSDAQTITQATTIAGGDVITLTGNGANRLFVVAQGASLTLQHIVLDNGRTNGGFGGTIHNSGGLRLDHVRIQNSLGNLNDYGGAIATYGPLEIKDSVLHHNQAGLGGAIYADNFYHTARVVITNTTFSNNDAFNTSAGKGGAILLGAGAQLTMTDGLLANNSALQGGAIYQQADSHATLIGQANLSIQGNQAVWDGGALYNNGGTLYVEGADLLANTTPTATIGLGYGGAIYSLGTLFVKDSYLAHNEGRFGGAVCACGANPISYAIIWGDTFQQNIAGSLGGGLYANTGVVLTALESSFNGNTAATGGGLARINATMHLWRSSLTYNTAQAGGGLFLSTAPITDHTIGGYVDVHDVTISGNTAGGTLGGGVYNTGLAQLYSMTITDNSSGVFNESGADGRLRSSVLQNSGPNCHGTAPTDDSFNYATDLSCAFSISTQGVGLNPKLGPLTADGLLLPYYHMPAADSPLINHGPANASLCDIVDQRSLPRTDRCDIGAVEAHLLWLPLLVR